MEKSSEQLVIGDFQHLGTPYRQEGPFFTATERVPGLRIERRPRFSLL